MAVNVGNTYETQPGSITAIKPTSMSQENIDVPMGTGLITFGDQLYTATGKKYSTLQWGGCVRQRTSHTIFRRTRRIPEAGYLVHAIFCA